MSDIIGLVKDANGDIIPQQYFDEELEKYVVTAEGDVSEVDFSTVALLKDANNSIIPNQYFVAERGHFVLGTSPSGGGGEGGGGGGSTYILPAATTETIGGVKPDGSTIGITEDGTVSVITTPQNLAIRRVPLPTTEESQTEWNINLPGYSYPEDVTLVVKNTTILDEDAYTITGDVEDGFKLVINDTVPVSIEENSVDLIVFMQNPPSFNRIGAFSLDNPEMEELKNRVEALEQALLDKSGI